MISPYIYIYHIYNFYLEHSWSIVRCGWLPPQKIVKKDLREQFRRCDVSSNGNLGGGLLCVFFSLWTRSLESCGSWFLISSVGYGNGMGIVWEAYHKGVPLLGLPEHTLEFCVSDLESSIIRWALFLGCLFQHLQTHPKIMLPINFLERQKTKRQWAENGKTTNESLLLGESPCNPDFSPPDLQAEVEDNYNRWTTDPPSPSPDHRLENDNFVTTLGY